jgi:hypothetical protein
VSEPEPASPGTSEEDSPAGPAEVPAERPAAPRWDPAEAFRETFLCHFGRRRDTTALRRVGQLLFDAVTEVPANRAERDPWTAPVQLRAMLADLRYLQADCEWLLRHDKAMKLKPRKHRLCLFAGELGEALAALADSLEQKLAERPSRPA